MGRCIMNLTRMESEFYHNVSPRRANLSLSIAFQTISHISPRRSEKYYTNLREREKEKLYDRERKRKFFINHE